MLNVTDYIIIFNYIYFIGNFIIIIFIKFLIILCFSLIPAHSLDDSTYNILSDSFECTPRGSERVMVVGLPDSVVRIYLPPEFVCPTENLVGMTILKTSLPSSKTDQPSFGVTYVLTLVDKFARCFKLS